MEAKAKSGTLKGIMLIKALYHNARAIVTGKQIGRAHV